MHGYHYPPYKRNGINIAPPTSVHELYIDREFPRDGRSVFVVNTAKSRWWGTPIKDLGTYGRRRFENWVILERPKERIKVTYGNY